MFADDKVTEIFLMADELCKFLTLIWKNITLRTEKTQISPCKHSFRCGGDADSDTLP